MNQHSPDIKRQKAAALVIALAFLLLISAVVLAFFNSAKNDRKNAASFANSQETMRLADTAVSLVMSQIRDATSAPNSAWASQPGMIRTYGTDGLLARALKLYSSDDMAPTVFGSTEMAGEITAMANWQTQPAHFVDLNAPAIVPRPDTADPTKTTNATVFPIVDPRVAANGSDGKPTVEGFSYSNTVPGAVTTVGGAASDNQRLPMPVKWLYVLRDGSLIAPATVNASTNTATFSGIVPSQANPITGRIAFWADDDTSKVNTNTASEGSFWDTPSSIAKSEAYMAVDVPVKGEFQATASHPATTCLSTVLGGAGTGLIPRSLGALAPFYIAASDYSNYFAPYFKLTPRISDNAPGGNTSQAGSAQTTSNNYNAVGPGRAVLFDTDRLYATTDELLFDPNRNVNTPLAGYPLTATTLSQRNFFLTANSRAPETTLFGTPRISLWPIQNLRDTPATVSQDPRDQLLAFCSTIGTNPYYFERYRVSIRQGGLTTNPSAASISADYDLVPRNQNLHSYITKMLQQKVPGFGSSFSTKWSDAGTARMATMAFDFIRSSVNLFRTPGSTTRDQTGAWGYEVPVPPGSAQGGYIMPLKINGNLGFGRNTTIPEVVVVFTAAAADPTTKVTTKWQAFMLFNLYRPVVETVGAAPGIRFQVTSPFGINGEIRVMKRMGGGEDGRNFAFAGAHTCLNKDWAIDYVTRGTSGNDVSNDFPFFTPVYDVNLGDTTFTFPGGPVTVQMKELDGANRVIQTMVFDFPSVTLPLPQSVDSSGGFVSAGGSLDSPQNFQTRMTMANADRNIVRPGDIARSVRYSSAANAPHKGDLRLLLLKENPTTADKWFEPNPQYALQPAPYIFPPTVASMTAARTNRFAHSLRNDMISGSSQPFSWTDGINGKLANNYPATAPSDFARGFHRAYLAAGYDNTQPAGTNGDGKTTPGGLFSMTPTNPFQKMRFGAENNPRPVPVIPQGLIAALNVNGDPGDFTNSYGSTGDGAVIAIPDFGALRVPAAGFFTDLTAGGESGEGAEPNRQVPSAVIFGTLPSLGATGEPAPWQTLLFNPVPFAGNNHPGFGTGTGGLGPSSRAPFSTLPDHLFLDLWWMPAVDPYAVSEPLSTAGKVNLNYQIAPFTYIQRETAVRAAMKSVRMAGFLDTEVYKYKGIVNSGDITDPSFYTPSTTRFQLNLSSSNGTLKGFEDRFSTGDIFRSASEICTIPMVADGLTSGASMATWWRTRRLTGDNLRESPYKSLYSRVTTKSNTFSVHYRVQALHQVPSPGRNWAEWTEGKDQVVGEYRGATTIERYLDAEEPGIPDYAAATLPVDPIDKFYRFRVLSTCQFAP